MEKRKLQKEWVDRTVNNPALIEAATFDSSLEHRLAPVPELANLVLRVIVSRDEPKRVIIVYLDRNMKGKI